MPGNEWSLRHHREEYVSDFGIVGFRGPKRPESCVYWNHMPAAWIRDKVGNEVWEKYFKFCVIRNPYEKAISAFYFRRAKNASVLMVPPSHDMKIADLDSDRIEFEKYLLRGPLPIDRDKYIIDGKFCLNDIIRYERLATDIERVCVRIGIPWDSSLLPSFKVGTRPKNASLDNIYTDKSRKIVESAFSFELKYFNYSFPIGNS